MIGKGAQYLTAAGFGRYRITAASLGRGWVMCPWLLSGAARNAIMAAFGVDGTAVIRATNEYLNGIAAQGQAGKAKATALAGFINEDPMMVCSLGLEPTLTTLPAMPWRLLTNDAQGQAYIDTNIKGNRNTEIEATFIIGKYNSNLAITIFGTWVGATGENNAITPMLPLQGATVNRAIRFGANLASAGLTTKYNLNTLYTMKQNKEGVWMDGTKVISYNQTSTFTTPGTITFLKIKGAPDVYNCLSGGLAKARLGGDSPLEMYAFKRNGVLGMIDVLHDVLYTNAGSGQFTEEFGYMQNGSWVTWTPPTP